MAEPLAKRINVLIITPTLECGGAERFVSILCNNIDTSLYRVTLVVIDNSRPFFKITNDAVTVIDLGKKRVSRSFYKLARVIKKEKPDIVFSTANHLNLFVAIFKFLFSKKIIWIARETSVASINIQHARHPVLYRSLLKKFYRRLDHIICQSAFMQQDLVQHFHVSISQTSVIKNAVTPQTYYEGPIEHQLYLTVARLSPEKGIARILQVLSTLKFPFNYYVIGDGQQSKELADLVKELDIPGVHFLDECAQPFHGFEQAGLFLMGSYYEGFPNAVLEANAIGIPVVAWKAPGGITDIITDEFNGFIAKDEDDFRNAIIRAGQFPFNRSAISAHTLSEYSLPNMITSIQSLLVDLYTLKKK